MNKQIILRQDEHEEGTDLGGGNEVVTPPAESEAPPTGDDNLDEFGYVKTEAAPPESVKPDTSKKPVEEVKEEIAGDTGYGKEAIKGDEKEEEPPPKEEKIDLGYELNLKDLEADQAKAVSEFAKKNSLSKEAAQAFADLRKSEIAAAKKADVDFQASQKKAVADLKASWDKELRNHPTFGGENFARNVMRTEKVLSEFMPETKKELTARKSMLPPYVMRDMAKLADHLYGSEKFVQGGAKIADEESAEEDDGTAFYKS